ncbi:amidase-like [Anneissia japonica]|uniref:amidase-like n=1 Tax=Anneissia japonica TaxID=1529436 RepID=UPI0014254B05|nr:amidase-like [Anneissia japonica]
MCAFNIFSARPVRVPSIKKIFQLSARIGCDLSEVEACQYQDVMGSMLEGVNIVDAIPEPTLPVKYPRTPGYRPPDHENLHRAWYWKTNIIGAKEGILKDKRIVLKDTIAVAGVPMMAGSWLTENYVPEFDATVTTRILDAGGVIAGKSVCEDWCYSDSSFTAAKGPVLNPVENTVTAGGSSSGSAVLVATGEVDMSLGGDQGGSIRTPASCCGIVGLKPTHGLVPYTGILPLDFSLDHVGPMARKVYDCALLLEAIAGYDDGLDPRQPDTIKSHQYTKELGGSSLKGFSIGILKEGFDQETSDSRVDKMVKKSAFQLISLDAKVEEVSVPMHITGRAIASVIALHSVVDTMLRGGSAGTGYKGFYPTSWIDAIGRSLQSQPDDLPPNVKACWMLGEYLKHEYRNKYYAKAQNIRRLLTEDFEKAFEKFDAIAMPTLPFLPPKMPSSTLTIKEYTSEALFDNYNLHTFNATGHPALSINAGFVDGLPVGMMLVGRKFDEHNLLKVAYAFEKLRDKIAAQ